MAENYGSYLGRLMKNNPAWDLDRLTSEVKTIKEGGFGGGGGGSVVVDSAINGNIKVNGTEVKVYDDSSINTALNGKASSTHNHDGVYSSINHNHSGVYEPVISSKGTAFNKNFGSVAGSVSEGNHTHIGMVTSSSVSNISVLTQTQYDALGTEKNTNNVLYVIRG
jgi:hypothetical protein